LELLDPAPNAPITSNARPASSTTTSSTRTRAASSPR